MVIWQRICSKHIAYIPHDMCLISKICIGYMIYILHHNLRGSFISGGGKFVLTILKLLKLILLQE